MVSHWIALLATGLATYYNPGLMQTAYEHRLAQGLVVPCAECRGMVAMLEPEYIGRKVWLKFDGAPGAYGPFLVVDCAPQDAVQKQALMARGWVLDIDYPLAVKIGMNTPMSVRVFEGYEDAPCKSDAPC